MSTRRTLDPPASRDAYSFRGLGRWRYAHTRPDRAGLDELEAPPRPEVPVGPGEPRG